MSRIGAADPATLEGHDRLLRTIRTGRGWIPNIFRTMLFSPDVTEGWVGLANSVRSGTSLPDRTRELVILLVAHLHRSTYEWEHHRGVATRTGVTPDEVERITAWPDDAWEPLDRATLALAAATATRTALPDDALDDLLRERGHGYVVDVAVTAAYYSAVALFTAVLAVEPETSAEASEHRT